MRDIRTRKLVELLAGSLRGNKGSGKGEESKIRNGMGIVNSNYLIQTRKNERN